MVNQDERQMRWALRFPIHHGVCTSPVGHKKILPTMKFTVLKGIKATPCSTPTAACKPYCKGMCGHAPCKESPNQPAFVAYLSQVILCLTIVVQWLCSGNKLWGNKRVLQYPKPNWQQNPSPVVTINFIIIKVNIAVSFPKLTLLEITLY